MCKEKHWWSDHLATLYTSRSVRTEVFHDIKMDDRNHTLLLISISLHECPRTFWPHFPAFTATLLNSNLSCWVSSCAAILLSSETKRGGVRRTSSINLKTSTFPRFDFPSFWNATGYLFTFLKWMIAEATRFLQIWSKRKHMFPRMSRLRNVWPRSEHEA